MLLVNLNGKGVNFSLSTCRCVLILCFHLARGFTSFFRLLLVDTGNTYAYVKIKWGTLWWLTVVHMHSDIETIVYTLLA